MVCSAQTMHLSWVKISTISEQTISSFHFSLITEYHRVRQKKISAYGMFGANCAPILQRQQHYLQTEQNNIPHESGHLGVPSGASKMISEDVVRLAQTVHLYCVKISTISERTELSFHLSLIT
jgi:hypothetical protein